MICPQVRLLGRTGSRHYIYEFQHRPSYSHAPPYVNATHFQDVAFTFGIRSKANQILGGIPDASDIKVSDDVMQMWVNFATTGNPNSNVSSPSDQTLMWPSFSESNPWVYTIDASSFASKLPSFKYADFFEKVVQRLDTAEGFGGAIVG